MNKSTLYLAVYIPLDWNLTVSRAQNAFDAGATKCMRDSRISEERIKDGDVFALGPFEAQFLGAAVYCKSPDSDTVKQLIQYQKQRRYGPSNYDSENGSVLFVCALRSDDPRFESETALRIASTEVGDAKNKGQKFLDAKTLIPVGKTGCMIVTRTPTMDIKRLLAWKGQE